MQFTVCSSAQFVAILLATALPVSAYEVPLTERSVREAYFLGQRRDEKMGRFLAEYAKHLPLPEKGPHVAETLAFKRKAYS